MCGIAGFYFKESNYFKNINARDCIEKMTQTLEHRGPDGKGVIIDNPIAFGHRRLSIIDLSLAGSQPMRISNDGPVITFNGEIYNFLELKKEINALENVVWKSRSDTEVILRAYNLWGLDGLKKLEGIFAIALWDPLKDRFILMRDRLGIKPLYFMNNKQNVLFGSEIKSILSFENIDKSISDQSFREYLWYGNSYEDRTFYKNIFQIKPGNWLIIEKGETNIEPWFKIEDWLNPCDYNFQDSKEILISKIDQAVKRQLVGDVPLSLFLSGGLDSSTIAASTKINSYEAECYTATFNKIHNVDEYDKAKEIANHLDLQIKKLEICDFNLLETIKYLSYIHDEPFADAANIPLYLMARELGNRIKVVLQGDGGDELFAGYKRYSILQNKYLWNFWPNSINKFLYYAGDKASRLARMANALNKNDDSDVMSRLLTMETDFEPPENILQEEKVKYLKKNTNPFVAYENAGKRFSTLDPVNKMLLTDLTLQLPSQFLNKVDRATMAAGVEARVPLLDENVVKFVISMPSSWKVKRFRNKIILRDSLKNRIPKRILSMPKAGFGVPYSNWIRTTLYDDCKERILDRSFINRFDMLEKNLNLILEKHKSKSKNYGFLLWKIYQLAIWHSKN